MRYHESADGAFYYVGRGRLFHRLRLYRLFRFDPTGWLATEPQPLPPDSPLVAVVEPGHPAYRWLPFAFWKVRENPDAERRATREEIARYVAVNRAVSR